MIINWELLLTVERDKRTGSSNNELGGEWLESSPAGKVWGCWVAAAPQSQQSHKDKPHPGQGKHRWSKKVGIPLRLEVVLECCVQLWTPPSEKDIQGHECGWSSPGITFLCWKNLPREVPAAPSPSVFKRYLDNSLNNTCEVLASPEVALGQDDGCRFLPTELLLVPPQWLQRGAW